MRNFFCKFVFILCVLHLTACTKSKTPVLNPNKNHSQDDEGGGNTQNTNSQLVINEIVAKSIDSYFLNGNDWIEIYNRGTQSIDLSAYSLADSSGIKFALPSQFLAPGAYLVIAAVDSDDLNPPLPSIRLKLGSEDSLTLFFGAQSVDHLFWSDGDANKGYSFGWVDGVAQTTMPTPNQANQIAVNHSALVISEIVAKSDDEEFLDGNDWIEIYNSGLEVIDLSDYFLADDSSDLMPLPARQLNAKEYFVIAAVDAEDVNAPTPSVLFKLGEKDSVLLFKADQLVDEISWRVGEAEKGNGYGRVAGIAVTTIPTPNAVNQSANIPPKNIATGNSPLVLNEVVIKSVDNGFLDGSDWIEIYNSGSTVVDLSGYTISDSTSEALPLSGSIEPGQYIVIAAVDSDAVNPPQLSVPFKLGADDAVYLYLGTELVRSLSWFDDEVSDGASFGLLNDVAQVLTPTPGQANSR